MKSSRATLGLCLHTHQESKTDRIHNYRHMLLSLTPKSAADKPIKFKIKFADGIRHQKCLYLSDTHAVINYSIF